MTHLFFSLFLGMVASSAALADSSRDIRALPITCVGTTAGKTIALSVVTVEENATRLQIVGKGENLTIENPAQLTVGSEGNVYIQQVLNRSYNLFLSGKGLQKLLDGTNGEYSLSGNIDLFGEEERGYKLTCVGKFVE